MVWQRIVQESILFRRELHAIPELRWQETKTSTLLGARLTASGIPWRKCAGVGIVAHLAHSASGPHVGLRADMDGLALTEKNNFSWASQHAGCMHACGHDGHMATLLAVAQWLKLHENQLPGPVSFLFQPAEEGGFGAVKMIEDGALDGVDMIYGWHNWPSIPFGKAVCPEGPVMAANGSFAITLNGRGGHASQPELCKDPVLAAAALTVNLQQIVSRRIMPQIPAVFSLTSLDARSGETTIPEKAVLKGTVRAGLSSVIEEIGEMIKTITTSTASAYGVGHDILFSSRYPATVNNRNSALQFANRLEEVLGENWQSSDTPTPLMASEDFSYYLQRIPGAFVLVGAGEENALCSPCHSANYDFNDRLIEPMMKILSKLAGLEM